MGRRRGGRSELEELPFVQICADDGRRLDARFAVVSTSQTCEVVLAARGGAADDPGASNKDYIAAMRLLLARLKDYGAVLDDIRVDSRVVAQLSPTKRRVRLDGRSYPIAWNAFDDLDDLRTLIGRGVANVGRKPGSKGGGNPQKRIRIVTDVPSGEDTLLSTHLRLGFHE